MITWFDALLVTLWAAVTMLALRRGLAGGLWAALSLLAALLSNSLPWPAPSFVLAAALSAGAAWLARRVFWSLPIHPWHLAVGGAGGLALGFALVAALALSFPLKVIGSQGTYPSSDLPAPLYDALANSLFVKDLTGVWNGPRLAQLLLAPDRR